MPLTLLILGSLLSPQHPPALRPSVSPAAFRAWFDAARSGRLAIPADVERGASRYRYVFVAGFWNEQMPGYFAQNVRHLRARGVPSRSIHVVSPSSHKNHEDNADSVRDAFHEIARGGPEKLVVIAHSRGSCDTLAFALRDPQFVHDRVEALFLVQGPFGGTGVADYVAGEGPAADRQLPLGHRLIVRFLARLETLRLRWGGHAGLPEMTRRTSRDFWDRLLQERAGAIPVVAPKTVFITSTARPPHLHPFRRAIAAYLSTYFGPNDGVVAQDDQSLPGFGTVVSILDIGHSDLTARFPSARPRRRLRNALIDAVLMAVAEPKIPQL